MATSPYANIELDTDRRTLAAWWRVEGLLTLTSASQIGSAVSDTSDQTFARDAHGHIVLHGSTLAGALRSALTDRLAGYRENEATGASLLFGDGKTNQSLAIVFDGVSRQPASASIRDGVRIEVGTGLAADGAKFDREVTLPGIEVPIRVDLQIPADRDESSLLGFLDLALASLTDGSVRLGARRSRGMGAVVAGSFYARRYDLATTEGWIEYGSSPHEGMPPGSAGPFDIPGTAISDAWSGYRSDIKLYDARCRLSIDVNLKVHGTLLVRSPGEEAGSADVSHLTEDGKAILSGTSLAGALRSRATRILNTLGCSDTPKLIDGLFGQTASKQLGSKTEASRLRVSESTISGNMRYRQTRVKIDRFTGSSIDTALFDVEPSAGGVIAVNVSVINPSDFDTGLCLLLVRDLIEGQLPLGGGASGGRGIVRGVATVKLPDGSGGILDRDGDTDDNTAAALQKYVDAVVQGTGGNA
jgi:CRISPR/Cas system CSM-associated protein Csm3 (group 7 of RAMP superfamily)